MEYQKKKSQGGFQNSQSQARGDSPQMLQFKREIAGLPYNEQCERVKPPAPIQSMMQANALQMQKEEESEEKWSDSDLWVTVEMDQSDEIIHTTDESLLKGQSGRCDMVYDSDVEKLRNKGGVWWFQPSVAVKVRIYLRKGLKGDEPDSCKKGRTILDHEKEHFIDYVWVEDDLPRQWADEHTYDGYKSKRAARRGARKFKSWVHKYMAKVQKESDSRVHQCDKEQK